MYPRLKSRQPVYQIAKLGKFGFSVAMFFTDSYLQNESERPDQIEIQILQSIENAKKAEKQRKLQSQRGSSKLMLFHRDGIPIEL